MRKGITAKDEVALVFWLIFGFLSLKSSAFHDNPSLFPGEPFSSSSTIPSWFLSEEIFSFSPLQLPVLSGSDVKSLPLDSSCWGWLALSHQPRTSTKWYRVLFIERMFPLFFTACSYPNICFEEIWQFSVFCVSLAIYEALASVSSLLSSPFIYPSNRDYGSSCGIDIPKWRGLENQPEANPKSVSSVAPYNFAHHCFQLLSFLDTKRVPGTPLFPSILQCLKTLGFACPSGRP